MQLGDSLDKYFRLSPAHAAALGKLSIRTVRDLLYHFPARYERAGDEASISSLATGQEVSIVGTVEKLEAKKGWKSRIPMTEGYIRDASGRIKVRWFNQPYIAKMYADGTLVKATGKVTGSAGKEYLANPQLQKINSTDAPQKSLLRRDEHDPNSSAETSAPLDLFAIYPESRGVSSLWLRSAVKKIVENGLEVEDPLSPAMLKQYNLPTLKTALVWAHQPKELKQAEATAPSL